MCGETDVSRQAELSRLRQAVEAELGRGPFCLGLSPPLRDHYRSGIAAGRARQLTHMCLLGSALYALTMLLTSLLAGQVPDWPAIGLACLLPPFLALSIAYVAFRPENAALLREGGAFAAASCCSLTTLLAVCTGPGTATVPNLFLVSLAVVVAVFFAPLRFAAAAALVTLTALALWLALLMWVDAPASLRFYPLDFLLAVSAPALFAVHRLERSARDAYLNAMLQDLRIEQLAFENSLLSQLSATDALTGAANRRHLEHTLHMLCTEPPCGDFLLLADIDFFKRFNDSHGHIAGDACLREVVAAMRSQVRRSDLVARFGGEEFAIILPRTTYADALAMAERIRAGVAGHCMRVAGRMEQVTVSIGVAERGRAMAPSTLLALADDALYAAKREGRNRVHCAMQPAQGLAA